MKNWLKNWKLIRRLKKMYKVTLFYGLRANRGHIAYDKQGKTVYIKIPLVPTMDTVLTFLHELGHHLHPEGKSLGNRSIAPLIQTELNAWEYAFILAVSLNLRLQASDFNEMKRAFSSYVLTVNIPLKEKIEWLNKFDETFLTIYLGDKHEPRPTQPTS